MQALVNAAVKKYRWSSPTGNLSFEDLFDLPLTSTTPNKANLNDIAVGLYKKSIESAGTIKFVGHAPASPDTAEINEKLELVKLVIEYKENINRATTEANAKKAQKEKILNILADKQDEALKSKSIDELLAMLNS